MLNRRKFLQASFTSSALLFLQKKLGASEPVQAPVVISTWGPNMQANAAAWTVLSANGYALDAVEKGVRVTEADPRDQSVGYGGLPDRDGFVTLDACVMNELGNCGAVMALEQIMHPVSVARLVMEKTPHVQLVGAGALQFALSQGFKKENLLTEESKKAWKDWLKTANYNPMTTMDNIQEEIKKQNAQPGQINNHDTIGMLALDAQQRICGACSTSGMAFKMRGRVGDSPVIGAGLFVDNEVGAATATGVGEEIVRIAGAHTIVEYMRQGYNPEDACKKAVGRIIKHQGSNAKNIQAAFIALNKKGAYGAYAVLPGFNYAVKSKAVEKVINAKSWFS